MHVAAAPAPILPRQLAAPQAPPPLNQEEEPPAPPSLKDRVSSAVGDGLNALAYTHKALPNFIYPSVFGTAAEKARIWQTLDSLPMYDAVRPISISVRESLGSSNLLGVTRPAINSIELNRTGIGMTNPENFRYTLIHEIGHTRDYEGGVVSVITGGHSSSEPFGAPPYVSRYAGTLKQEDFAETYAEYRLNPDRLRHLSQEKMDAMERLDRPNFMQAFVDREEFRETGKLIARGLEVPYLRWGLGLLTQVAAYSLAANGVGEVISGVSNKDTMRAVSGGTQLAAGASLMFSYKHPVLGFVAMGALGAHRGLEIAQKKGARDGASYAALAGGAMGGMVGGIAAPLGLTMLGYQVAGPVGGAVGLVVGGVLGNRLGAAAGAHAGLALAG